MSIFQPIILKNHLKKLNIEEVCLAWIKFQNHFHNNEIQANIKASKEEQYQEGFLRDLFVNIFGYTLNPNTGFNLTTELKNIKGSKKCDGAILEDNKALAVIELKGMDTTDLSNIESQAFGYKNNHPTCRYVITSNFQKLRFYIDNAVEYAEFDLFKISQEDFSILYLLLKADNLLANIPLKIKSESISQEEQVTKQLYKDYSTFKRALFDDLVKNNIEYDPLVLFQKSQKLLDRLLFIFFAEDSGLLSANTARTMLKEWENLKALKMPISVYDQLKRYFGFLNTGYKDENSEIFAYNGGLFKPDEILDNVKISDEILAPNITKLADYDFASEVDVNILGHIFENSLTEIEEIKAELNDEQVDKTQSKRKKDGVFYTPKYITNYIIENTVGRLCADKKAQIGIIDEQYIADKKRQKKTQEILLQRLKDYRDWLLDITVCDPSCGSGAFLNEALNFLMAEHSYLDELESKLFGGGLVFQEVRNHILENNLFGVDINQESVEIAKLSLWLRTAEPHRKLSNLNENLKCGNSLINDKKLEGDKAFHWEKEFPKVFEKGGFDVVIGNPPYVQLQKIKEVSNKLEKLNYETFEKTSDLYVLFYELGNQILKNRGLLGFITSNKWLRANYGKKLRQYLYKHTHPILLMDLGAGVFESATVDSNILIFQKTKNSFKSFRAISLKGKRYDFENIEHLMEVINPKDDAIWGISSVLEQNIKSKVERTGTILKEWGVQINYGVKSGFNEAFIIDEKTKDLLISQDCNNAEIIKPILRGRDLDRYNFKYENLYIITTFPSLKIDIESYPFIKDYLEKFGVERLQQTGDKGSRKKSRGKWYETQDIISYWQDFNTTNIFYPDICQKLSFSLVDNFCLSNTGYFLNTDNKYLIAILNSKLLDYYYRTISAQLGNTALRCFTIYIENLPVPIIDSSAQLPYIEKAEEMLNLNKELQGIISKFLRTLERKFGLIEPSKNLQNWQVLTYKEFTKELTKKKIKLSVGDEAEWEDYFLAEQTKAQAMQTKIQQTDKEIDNMVYQLYKLTNEEIKLIEANTVKN